MASCLNRFFEVNEGSIFRALPKDELLSDLLLLPSTTSKESIQILKTPKNTKFFVSKRQDLFRQKKCLYQKYSSRYTKIYFVRHFFRLRKVSTSNEDFWHSETKNIVKKGTPIFCGNSGKTQNLSNIKNTPFHYIKHLMSGVDLGCSWLILVH